MQALKVLIADDHECFRRSLLSFLRTQKGVEVVGEASDGVEAVDQTARLHPDLVLIDSDMPKQDGFRATQEIKLRSPGTTVVVLSMNGTDPYRRRAHQHSADGFIEKGSLKAGLVAILFDELLRRQGPDMRIANA